MSENERWYDEEVAPQLMKLAEACQERGVAMLAVVEYDPGEVGRTSTVSAQAGLTMRWLAMLAQAGRNIDAFRTGVLRDARARGVAGLDGSMFLHRFLGDGEAR